MGFTQTKSRLRTTLCAKKLWKLTMLLSSVTTNVFSADTRLLRNVKNTWRNSIFTVKMRRNVKPPKPWLNNKNLKRIVYKKKEKNENFNENKNNCEKFKRKPSQKKWSKLPKLKLAKKSSAKWTKKNWQIWILKQS